jgi:hypothetical protein
VARLEKAPKPLNDVPMTLWTRRSVSNPQRFVELLFQGVGNSRVQGSRHHEKASQVHSPSFPNRPPTRVLTMANISSIVDSARRRLVPEPTSRLLVLTTHTTTKCRNHRPHVSTLRSGAKIPGSGAGCLSKVHGSCLCVAVTESFNGAGVAILLQV